MIGDNMSVGLLTMALMDLLTACAARSEQTAYTISVSLMELYNEQLQDLFLAKAPVYPFKEKKPISIQARPSLENSDPRPCSWLFRFWGAGKVTLGSMIMCWECDPANTPLQSEMQSGLANLSGHVVTRQHVPGWRSCMRGFSN